MTALADLAVIFAGGEASRFGGIDKGALVVSGAPLWRRVSDRLGPQARQIVVVAPRPPDWVSEIQGAVWLPDASATRIGPAAALASGLKRLIETGGRRLVTSPIDAAFVPDDLVARLSEVDAPVVIAKSDGDAHPVFGQWSAAVAPLVFDAIAKGEHSLRRLAELCGCAMCEAWEDAAPDPFFNINTPADLAVAEVLARASG